ncbi:MAG: L-aspartate oxidase [Candidatus Thorarchaeota archaeon]
MSTDDVISSDYLVIGSGLAGLLFAIKAARHGTVNIVTKRGITECASSLAQGGIAAVVADDDSFEAHIADTMRAGAGLCHRDVVESFIRSAPERIRDLVSLGVKFSARADTGTYELGLEGGHSRRRVLHIGDHTGRDIQEVLVRRVTQERSIRIFQFHMAVSIATRKNSVVGAYVLDRSSGQVKRFAARATVLATGGMGKVFRYTSNPEHATGDGVALAYRAGATITNMEMIQFHPTLLYSPKVRSFLVTEALRGEGAVLVGRDGDRFMSRYHPDLELAPRDIVTRAIDHELKRTGDEHVWLDISFRDREFIKSRFPQVYSTCLQAGVDITTSPIPVVPGAHYLCGGVKTDMCGRTDLDGLFAIGETAGTGFHGANRLASNSLLECIVMAHNAAEAVRECQSRPLMPDKIPPWEPGMATDPDELVVMSHMWDEIRSIMTNYVGVVRSNKRLLRARNRIDSISREIEEFYRDFRVTADLVELRNIATVAELVVRMARMRRESRGVHFNIDYPDRLDYAVDTVMKKGYCLVVDADD